PLARLTFADNFKVEGQPALSPEQAEKQFAFYRDITSGYFRTMGIPLLQGRDFNERDTENSPGVVIVNQIMARTFWPREPNVIGKRILKGDPPRAYQVVGVVDTREFHQDRG